MLSRCAAVRVLLSSPISVKRFIICSSFSTFNYLVPPTAPPECFSDFNSKEVALSFKDWFKRKNDTLIDQIFEILAPKNDDLATRKASELALSRLGLKLSEEFVLSVFNHGKDVLSCLKFFDWAGRQHGYNHTRATFNAIFKILSREKLMSLMLDFLETYKHQKHLHNVRFYDTLVMGYAVAGKPDIALQLFGKMRFQGIDLDPFVYHVFLNALVEQSCFDVVDVISEQITMRGYENEITTCIRVKNFCKQNKLEEAEKLLREVEKNGGIVTDYMLRVLVDSLCKTNKFEEAGKLLEDFWQLRKVPMPQTYNVWIRDLVQAGNLDAAMKFLRNKQFLEGYMPDVFRYNILICRLLRENRLQEVCDLLMEMREVKISPDKVTMNASLCFFCKAGMVDVALELYNSRSEFDLSLNSLAYNYLINTLCGDGSVDEAYTVLRDSIEKGYFPGKKTFDILADALCREGKLDKMKELIIIAIEQNVTPSDSVCFKFISALCKASRVEDGYLIHGELSRISKTTHRSTYIDLIRGFNRSKRGDMASRLLIEMQENGHTPTRSLYRAVINAVCNSDNAEHEFVNLLEIQLSRNAADFQVYNFFIDGAGHARRPELAREVLERMKRRGVEVHLGTKVLMLQSCLKSERISDALDLFGTWKKENTGRKLYDVMVVGLCQVNKPDFAEELLAEVKEKGLIPSLQCYEELVRTYCVTKKYDKVVEVVQDLEASGRQASSFIGNVLLYHSIADRQLYQTWTRVGALTGETSQSCTLTLGQLVGLFSGGIRVDQHLENLDEVIEQCFPPNIFTYNMLLRRLTVVQTMDYACKLFYKMCRKGFQPNRWTYDIIVHGFCKHGMRGEAHRWVNEMRKQGFQLTESTQQLIPT